MNLIIKPSKKLGQNFLVDPKTQQLIANLVINAGFNHLVEIGSGQGAITQYLVKNNQWQIVGVELDKRLHQYLTKRFKNYPQIQFINNDFLLIDVNQYFPGQKVLLFGNIPYSISTKIIKNFLSTPNYPMAFLMMQKEYYDRLVAQPGDHNYGSLSVYIQTFCRLKKELLVNNTCFKPTPKVDSVVFSIRKLLFNWSVSQINAYSWFIKNCFQMKRKTIFNNLKKFIDDQELIQALLFKSNLDPKIRPDQISIEQYQQFFINYQLLITTHNVN